MESFSQNSGKELSADDLCRGRDQVLAQMTWARQYSLQLIESVPAELWYARPLLSDGRFCETHLAWQVGHLAVSQYGLMLFRQRGRMPGDLELMPGWLRKQFGRSSTPSATSEGMPTPEDLLARLSNIHAQAIEEVSALTPETLGEPTEMPFTAYPIKLGALLFAPIHESLHAGQIGLIRRLHGLEPLR
jgi:hypothetical protein